ncbi:MAG: type II secretion system protein N [Pseudomonadota bacterium]
MMGFRRARPRWAPTESGLDFKDSTLAEIAWDKSRNAGRRWALAGVVAGAVIGLVAFAPASWLARSVASATSDHVVLADARGTIWNGSAVMLLTGGKDSRDASALPGRIQWTIGMHRVGFEVQATQACCLNGRVSLLVTPGWNRVRVSLVPPAAGSVGQWPSAWLAGLGTPWNTLQLQGTARLSSSGLTVESVEGRWLVTGQADLDLVDVSSRLSTRQPLGSYRLTVRGDAASGGSTLTLSTQSGALQLSGSGLWGAGGVRFRGEARSSEEDQAVLQNLLNIIGRRDGARSVISIG